MKKTTLFTLIAIITGYTAIAANYYCDPASGNMSNPGTAASPWSTLEAVFTANKTFQAGDIIYLRNGYHGFPTVKGNNSGYVTIQPESGHTPTVKKLIVTNAMRWVISGLTISPEVVNSYERGTFVDIRSSASYITLKDCFIYSALNPAGWSQSDWETRMGNGINCSGPNCLITNNHIKNTDFSLSLSRPASYSVVSYNTIENVMGDALRGLSDYGKFEYNTVKNFYVANANHDDIFQSWTGGSGGIPVGTDTVVGIEIRGNTFISHTDPNQPLITHPQAIGCFDGMFKDWIIENNLIISEHWHGITLLGAINCRIVNNTLVENPLNLASGNMAPWIQVAAHKNGTKSTGNLVRNNFTSTMSNDANIGTVDNNIISKNYTAHFVNYAGSDLHLKPGSPAIDAGSNVNAPAIDLEKNPRVVPYDIGCYEYTTSVPCGGPDVWVNSSFSRQAGTFTAEFDASPSGDNLDGVIGLSDGAANAFTSLACIVRFNASGNIDARNGGAYQAQNTIPYTKGNTYHIRMVVNITTKKYDVFVTAPGGSEQVIGTGFDFRTEQNTVTGFDNLAKNTASCSVTISNFKINSTTGISNLTPSGKIRIYPNPVHSSTVIELPPDVTCSCKLTLYDLQGRIIHEADDLQEKRITLYRKDLKSGIYFCTVKDKTGRMILNEKLVLE